MLKAVIFDMDGVLVDSEPMHARCIVETMKQFGVEITTEYNYRFIGSTALHMYDTIIKEFNLEITTEDIQAADIKSKEKLVKEEGYTKVAYTKELIEDLYHHGVKLAIASSSSMNDIIKVTNALGIRKYFDKLVSGATLEKPKPAPDIFIQALAELEANSKETLVIEDSMNGTIAASSAGIPCIGFINKNSGNQDLSAANVLIESFKDIDYKFLNAELSRANGEPVTIATTDRIELREMIMEDIESLYQIYQEPNVKQFINDMNDNLEEEIEKHKAYIKYVYNFYGYGLWGIFLKNENILIGRCGIQNREINGQNEVELGYLLSIKFQTQGYALESITATIDYAFNTLLLPSIVAVIDKQNERSIKVAKKVGMTLEKEVIDNKRNCYLYRINNPKA